MIPYQLAIKYRIDAFSYSSSTSTKHVVNMNKNIMITVGMIVYLIEN